MAYVAVKSSAIFRCFRCNHVGKAGTSVKLCLLVSACHAPNVRTRCCTHRRSHVDCMLGQVTCEDFRRL